MQMHVIFFDNSAIHVHQVDNRQRLLHSVQQINWV